MSEFSTVAAEIQKPSWRPILDGEIKERALRTVEEIVASLPHPGAAEFPITSLAGGTAGLAVLNAYLARAGWKDDEHAAQLLAHAVDSVLTQPMTPSLYSGFTGIAWAVAHLQAQLFDPEDDPNEAIDEALTTYLEHSPWLDGYDLISGLVGIGVYALECLPRVRAIANLERVVDRLAETAEHSGIGVTWLTRAELLPDWQQAICPEGYYNLGLAHGVPAVIAFLGEVCAAEVAMQKARPLLNGAIDWLLQQRLTGTTDSTFSAWVSPGIERDGCRLAWCYGDAGVAAALLGAARCVNDRDWEREALTIARRAAGRRPETAGVMDAGLCHGAAGLGHIFNRLFQATGEQLFGTTARYWFERTLALKRDGQGIAGFSAYRAASEGRERYWEDEPGILEGAAGIALALLAAATNIEPGWDRTLLVSIPPEPSKTDKRQRDVFCKCSCKKR